MVTLKAGFPEVESWWHWSVVRAGSMTWIMNAPSAMAVWSVILAPASAIPFGFGVIATDSFVSMLRHPV